MGTHYVKRHDTAKPLIVDLQEYDGTPILVDGGTVKLRMRADDGTTVVDDVAMTLVDLALSRWSYAWQDGDTANAGTYQAEYHITFADGTTRTVPTDSYDRIVVIADLSGV